MDTVAAYPHVSVEGDGTARIGNTRYKVVHLAAEHYHHGWSAEELLRQHPDLRPEQVYAALAYFYDHYEILIHQMSELAVEVERGRRDQRLSRTELLARQRDS